MFETDYLLRSVAPLLPKLEVLFLPISPLDFHHDNGLWERRHEIRRAHYAITPTWSLRMIHKDVKNLVKGKLSAIVRRDHWRGVFKSVLEALRGPAPKTQSGWKDPFGEVDVDGYIGPRIQLTMKSDSLTGRIDEVREQIFLLKEAAKTHPNLPGEVYMALVSIIKTARLHNLKLVLFAPPQTDIFNEMLSKEGREIADIRNFYLQKSENEFGVEFYNFAQAPTFVHNYNYFFNEDHLNVMGARVFSQKLWSSCNSSSNELLTADQE